MSGRSGKKKMSKLSRSARAGVIFPVGRLMRYLKKGTFKYRISVGAPVYMAAVIEYLAGNVSPPPGSLSRPFHPCHPRTGRVALLGRGLEAPGGVLTGFPRACLAKIHFVGFSGGKRARRQGNNMERRDRTIKWLL